MEIIASAELVIETGEVFSLLYYLVRRDCYFGIRAEKRRDDCLLEWDCIQYLFESQEDAECLIRILAKNTVTPFSMCEVVDELMDEVYTMPKAV